MFCETGSIRLVGGTIDREGRVEICINETWGTVCDGAWSINDADVACRQLGYQSFNATPLYNSAFGGGIGRVWLDELECTGSEGRLIDCPNPGFGVVDGCTGHANDAGLRCQEGMV